MILQELKKIFGIKKVLLIFVFAVLYYFLFFRLNVGVPEYSSEKQLLEVSLELLERYGESMDEAEYRDLAEMIREIEESAADIWIKGNEEFKQYGMESYRDWLEGSGNLPDEAAASLSSQISERFTLEEMQKVQETVNREAYLNISLEAYAAETKSGRLTGYYSEIPENARKRLLERKQEEIYSLMPYGVMGNYQRILPDFAVFLFLSMIFLIVPYSVKDTMEGIPALQYTSRKGCRYYWKKLAAVFISALILCVVEIVGLAAMLKINHAFSFAGCFVSGFWNPFITIVKLTFGQYIVLSLAYIAGIALCLAMVTFCLSSLARNYVSAIAFQMPMVIFSFIVSYGFMYRFAEITQNIILLCMVPCICILAAAIGNAARFLSVKFYG